MDYEIATDERISEYHPIKSPEQIKKLIPISKELHETVLNQRESIRKILNGEDNRRILIVGPCSIYDTKSAIEYASKLKIISNKVKDKVLIIMRAYFEKPRTITGWRGLISDPHIDGSFDAELGYLTARTLLKEIIEIGLPIATEILDPVTPQYIDDTISWTAIGARTTESPIHRLLSSGLSIPVGFKNATSGDIDIAINAIQSAKHSGNFIGVNHQGQLCNVKTKGNPFGHIVLRGGSSGPNYDEESIQKVTTLLKENSLAECIIVDCSHQNSNKDFTKQNSVLKNCLTQITEGNKSIKGFMIESNLKEGNQKIPNDLTNFDSSTIEYGKSITDACIGWGETEKLILDLFQTL